jgi:AraC-like DNA-binding protein
VQEPEQKPVIMIDTQHPLIRQLTQLASEVTGSGFLIVYPVTSGWEQVSPSARSLDNPTFCKLIQGSAEGARHCRMCHIMMAVTACSGGAAVKQCHAGASVLVCPATGDAGESMAVLSSCTYSSEAGWAAAQRRGVALGIDPARLREAFLALPSLDERQLKMLKLALQAMSCALQMLRQNMRMAARLRSSSLSSDHISDLTRLLENPTWADADADAPGAEGDKPLLIRVVRELIRQRPDLPLTVKELAAAAHLSPNHFTTLFHEHAGVSFNTYLTEQRIARAKRLLRNPTLTVNEVARLVGYEDAGYFARRFHQATRYAPRDWRNRHALDAPSAHSGQS